jgi:hypothetical protein
MVPNQAPAPNRRQRFPLDALRGFVYLFRAPPASPTAVGEARRWTSVNRKFPKDMNFLKLAAISIATLVAVSGCAYFRPNPWEIDRSEPPSHPGNPLTGGF